MHALGSQIDSEIRGLLPKYQEFLSNLIRIDSVYGNEKASQLLIISMMRQLGLTVKTYYSREDRESINVVSMIKGIDENHKSLILNAHCDIAPVDGPDRWAKDPFSGEILDNIIYGRGSLDDKAGIAIILLLVSVLKNLNIKLKGDLIIESVIEDETTGNGSKLLVDHGYIADGVIIVDGTWPERIIYGHLGQVWLDMEITGEPVAACVEARGLNPIFLGMELIQALKIMVDALNQKGDTFENINEPNFINIGSFHSGVWPGSVPAVANLQLQIGFSDRYSPQDIIKMVVDIAHRISDRTTVRQSLLETPAYKTKKDNNLILKLKSIIENNHGKEVKLIPVTGHCDMRHFKTENICLYGPGGGKNPHGIDEHYFLEHMPQVTRNILDFVLDWCNEPK